MCIDPRCESPLLYPRGRALEAHLCIESDYEKTQIMGFFATRIKARILPSPASAARAWVVMMVLLANETKAVWR